MSIQLKPFFSYFGAKYRSSTKYPPPIHESICEPFAGAAGYSVRYYDRKVTLIEKNPQIAGIWDYLIKASRADIQNLPLLEPGQSIDTLSNISQEASWLIGMWVNPGSAVPKKTLMSWSDPDGYHRKFKVWGEPVRDRISHQVQFIRHWNILNCSYNLVFQSLPMQDHTWFIDPPYQNMGKHYPCGSKDINYQDLSYWVHSLPGQVIVCENHGADWLPFRELGMVKAKQSNAGRTHSHEVIWTNE